MAQAEVKEGGLEQKGELFYYEVRGLLLLKLYDPADPATSIATPNAGKRALRGIRFSVVDKVVLSGVHYYIVQILSIKKEPASFAGLASDIITSADNASLFFVTVADFDDKLRDGYIRKSFVIYRSSLNATYGANLALPLKFRPRIDGRNREISTDVAIGGYVGGRIRLSPTNNYYASLVGSLGVVLLPVNQENLKDATGEKAATITGLSVAAGAIFELGSFQFGALVGKDYAAGALGNNWAYNGKWWCGLSLGVSFFGAPNDGGKSDPP